MNWGNGSGPVPYLGAGRPSGIASLAVDAGPERGGTSSRRRQAGSKSSMSRATPVSVRRWPGAAQGHRGSGSSPNSKSAEALPGAVAAISAIARRFGYSLAGRSRAKAAAISGAFSVSNDHAISWSRDRGASNPGRSAPDTATARPGRSRWSVHLRPLGPPPCREVLRVASIPPFEHPPGSVHMDRSRWAAPAATRTSL